MLEWYIPYTFGKVVSKHSFNKCANYVFKKTINRPIHSCSLEKLATQYFELHLIIYNILPTLSLPSLFILLICFLKKIVSLSKIMINQIKEFSPYFMIQQSACLFTHSRWCVQFCSSRDLVSEK